MVHCSIAFVQHGQKRCTVLVVSSDSGQAKYVCMSYRIAFKLLEHELFQWDHFNQSHWWNEILSCGVLTLLLTTWVLHTHTYIHTYLRTHTHTYINTYICTHTYTHTHTHTHIHVHTHAYIHTTHSDSKLMRLESVHKLVTFSLFAKLQIYHCTC